MQPVEGVFFVVIFALTQNQVANIRKLFTAIIVADR